MSLTLERLHRLEAKRFDKLYEAHTDKWIEMVTNGRTYAESFIGDGEVIRPGDISAIIQNAIRVDPDFEAHVKGKLPQKYWVEWFADYILDQIFPAKIDKATKK
jgi:hypothetical protein